MDAWIAGFGLGLSLIVAIGAQNAFVLRQGLLRLHVLPIVLICALSDAILIAAGVAGVGGLTRAWPWFEPLMRWGGAAFLILYGIKAFAAAWTGSGALQSGEADRPSLWAAIVTCLLFTWANPHVYLDTVVLLGSVSSQYDDRLGFALGAMGASLAFFFSLGYGARLLAPLFAKPRSWQVLDLIVGTIMWGIAASLIF
ncbi:Arginine exporter protein ArgO [Thalassovita gelatinovora]|uniref:Arginine exporter protein ArgO n=1 Tax=Thalassovita gelatinovora TaxID=53501 RepID=A0A0P1FPV1_THAGE|nr:LysE/ArgO family amino acid transporter [Thalassovita gelatinovora]QIZ80240.1 amino acid transporter [Thalassovita gelatinovora]CUH64111.1 Arginine exporter protein ArgO [Thalassovita gelatinovora]SEQ83513.1 L-lysine exporter family protein LysE/ArgO [Thalassovita gelatinovora]